MCYGRGVARIVDYAEVLQQVDTLGLTSAYYNTGAFTFPAGETVHIVGWTGGTDSTIRPGLATVSVEEPVAANLVKRLMTLWPRVIDGPAWVMPKSHWAFELDHGNGAWLGPALAAAGIDPQLLRPRTDGAAIEFEAGDPAIGGLLETLLTHLTASDFAILFPRHRHLITVHHHVQLWWQTTDGARVEPLLRGE